MTAARRPRLATLLAGLCVLALVGGLVLGFWLSGEADEVERTEQDRAEVVSAAERFTVTWNSIDPKQAESYIEQLRPLVTDPFLEKAFGGKDEEAARLIREGGVKSQAEVLVNGDGIPLIGVSALDPNSAVALVVADADRRVDGQRFLRHLRWRLDLVKEGDAWLVDTLTPVELQS